MRDESAVIVMLLADGQQRSFKEIQASTGLESAELSNELKSLTDDGLLEQTVVPDDDIYLITAKGLLASPDRDP
jgi:DNA-binding HxlR family transcriptional regulator